MLLEIAAETPETARRPGPLQAYVRYRRRPCEVAITADGAPFPAGSSPQSPATYGDPSAPTAIEVTSRFDVS